MRIVVSRSSDGGLTWDEPVSAVLSANDVTTASDESGQSVSSATVQFFDWPSLLIAPDPQQADRSNLFLTYTEFRAQFSALNAGELAPGPVTSTIRLVRSVDGGATWSDPIDVSPIATLSADRGSPNQGAAPSPALGEEQVPITPAPPEDSVAVADGRQVVQGAQAVALASGAILVAYLDTTEDGPMQGLARIMVAASTDGGRTFGEPVSAGIFRELASTPRTAFVHWWSSSFPRMTAGSDDSLVIATTARPAANPGDDADVLLFRSADGGASWSPPASLDETDSGSQFFPALAAAEDGTLHAIWADTDDDPRGVSFVIRHAQSPDNGATWQAGDPLAETASNMLLGFPGGAFLGDQVALAASSERIYAAWPDTRLASTGGSNLQIGFTGVTVTPES
jgi:hypothetical protein